MRTLFTTRMIVTIALLLMALPALGEPNREGQSVGLSEGNLRLDCTILLQWECEG
jgi:hypothetical protein